MWIPLTEIATMAAAATTAEPPKRTISGRCSTTSAVMPDAAALIDRCRPSTASATPSSTAVANATPPTNGSVRASTPTVPLTAINNHVRAVEPAHTVNATSAAHSSRSMTACPVGSAATNAPRTPPTADSNHTVSEGVTA